MAGVMIGVEIRPYVDSDESAVLGLLQASLGGGPAGARPAEFFRWKHRDNPFGPSYLLVAETQGRIVGLRAFMRWRFAVGRETLLGVRAVDTATHPDFQGQGIFSKVTRRALEDLPGEADFVFNTPNEKSLPGYLKMGWRTVGSVPIYVRIRRPLRFSRHARSWKHAAAVGPSPTGNAATPAREALSDGSLDALLGSAERSEGISTVRDARFIRWRYGDAPLLNYQVVRERVGGELRGLAIFRVRPRGALVEATVAELITPEGEVAMGRRLLGQVARRSSADHLTCSFPSASSAMKAARRVAFIRVPGGMRLVVNPLNHELTPDPVNLGSWALSAGDLEVF